MRIKNNLGMWIPLGIHYSDMLCLITNLNAQFIFVCLGTYMQLPIFLCDQKSKKLTEQTSNQKLNIASQLILHCRLVKSI